MKAWLNGPVGIVPLSTIKPTTIGRECCDVIIPCPAVDSKHAIIEYDERSECFILRDLNTIFGTCINGCQVCNAAVRLTQGDVIRIGIGQAAIQYEFDAEKTFSCPCPHHTAEMLNSSDTKERQCSSSKTCLKTTFPQLATGSSAPSSTASNMSVCHHGNVYPAFQQARPFSAKLMSNSMPYSGSTPKLNSSGANGQTYKDGRMCNESSVNLEEVLKKDRKISELNDEVHRLRKFEVENQHKDCQLKELSTQVECLQSQLSQAVSNGSNRIEVEALQARIADLENQIQLRTSEMAEINEQMFKLKTMSQKELNDKVLENNGLREELERFRKDKNILSGLLTQVQKDISMKDTTICRLTNDIERKKNELSDKDVQIASFQSSFCVVDSHKHLESDLEKMQGELVSVGEKLKKSESSLKASEERYVSLSKAMDKAKVELRQEKQKQKDVQKQLEEIGAKQGDTNKSNDALTQELRNLTSTLSRLRRRLQRLLSLRYLASSKDVTMTDEEDDFTDDQIVSKIKEIIEEGNNLSVKISDTNKKFEDMATTLKSVGDCGGKLKGELQVSTGSVNPNPANTLMMLRQELNAVQLLVAQPVLQDFRHILVSMIQVQLSWQNEMVTALETCGFNVRLSDVGLVKHVTELHSKSEESHRVLEESKLKMEEASRQFRRDLEEARDRGREEVEERSREKMEKLVIENEMKIRTEKAVFEQKEKENYEEKVNQERMKLAQLEERLCLLQKENAEKSEELIFYKQQEKQHTQEVESYRKVEAELRDEILDINLTKTETRSSIEHSVRKKYEREMATVREQNAHLSCTLASIQERLSKANNKIHRQQLEIASLKGNSCAAVNVAPYSKTAGGETVTSASFEVSRVNEKLRAEIRKHQAEIKKLTLEGDQRRSLITEKDGAIERLESELQNAKEDAGRLESELQKIKEDSARLEAELQKAKEDAANIQPQSCIPDELSAVGAECRGEQHVVTIARQQEALTELRKRMRSLQKGTAQFAKAANDSNPKMEVTEDSSDRLKAPESKSNRRLDTVSKEVDDQVTVVPDPSPVAPASLPADPVNDQIQRVQQNDTHNGQNKDLNENLKASEEAYSSLLRAVTEKLAVGKTVKKLPSLTDRTTSDERKQITLQRQDVLEEITAELSALKSKLSEYESTIEKNDHELMKLRTADVLLESKSWQIDGLTSDVRSLVDEVACLHESLTKVRDDLRKEKRLNAAAKGKKVGGEKDKGGTMGTIVKHTCFHNDSVYKTKERSKSAEKPKRKGYEIMLLKEEMKKCEKNMERARNVELMMADADLIDECISCACSMTEI